SLIGKPIHVTTDFDAHFEAEKQPKAIGVFMGGIGLENEDGTITVRAVGTLWEGDFPDEVDEIKKNAATLGASYEIQYLAASAARVDTNVIEISAYEFSGGAILKKSAAAHPESQVLVAAQDRDTVFDVIVPFSSREPAGDDEAYARLLAYLKGATSFTRADKLTYDQRENLSDSDFALIQTVDGKKVRRFPIQDEAHRKNAWARLPQAKGLSDAERSEVANKIMNKAKSAGDDWAKPYKKSNGTWTKTTTKEGAAMPKYTGIPAELESAVDAIVAQLKADAEKALAEQKTASDKAAAGLQAQIDQLKADMMEKDPNSKKNKEMAEAEAKHAEALNAEKGKVVDLTNQVSKLTADFEGAKAELQAKTTQLEEIEAKAKLAETVASLKADYGLTDEQLKEEKRAALVAKLAAAKEPLSAAEFKALIAGGKVASGAGKEPVPLFAQRGEEQPDEKAIARNFPAAGAVRFR
ncbi:MAG TPA: hypothetical protein VLA89_13510, partial [Gemmatimonadales bacterium]|nr:hypothetical protein [Gemmatimonadales bacterium]